MRRLGYAVIRKRTPPWYGLMEDVALRLVGQGPSQGLASANCSVCLIRKSVVIKAELQTADGDVGGGRTTRGGKKVAELGRTGRAMTFGRGQR